jgi:AcrR family transcriptional regulator
LQTLFVQPLSPGWVVVYPDQVAQQPVSRRDRPAKPALSREKIIDVALALLDEDGLDGVSMRRVAQQLDTGPASLYVYVRNRDELLAAIWDRVAGEVELPDPNTGWREPLSQLIANCLETFGRHKDLASLGLAAVPTGPNALRVTDAFLGILAESGISRQTRAWAMDLLGLFVTADGTEQAIRAQRASTPTDLADSPGAVFATAPADSYPHVRDLAPELAVGTGEERRRWMIDVLLNGILATDAASDR